MDRSLCFKTNSEEIKKKCLSRLNIIKILSHKSWKLTTETLTNLYKSLVGSILDYSFFTITEISISNLNFLQSIQNQAIKLIHKLKPDTSTLTLREISKIPPINDRFNNLFERYIKKALAYNVFIVELINEYNETANLTAYNEFKSTPLSYVTSLLNKNEPA